ncbi:MAG: sigma-70 family RNA polymerase sigma factor [Candidatus Glassbacteria bacterium]|nr:sigma-70 family RNA polymerase sigma factor [Candidatus Glassbacteria bacterium]
MKACCDIPFICSAENKSDEDLVLLFNEGGDWAFKELMERHSKKVLNYLNRMVYDRDRAQDLLQETFVRVFRNIERFDTSRKFSTWLYTIATNLAKNELRAVSLSPLLFFHDLFFHHKYRLMFEAADQAAGPDDQLYRSQLRDLVARAVRELPAHHRLVFSLREIEGKTYREIAEILGCGIGTVKSRLNRARKIFAGIIEPYLAVTREPPRACRRASV